MAFGHASCMWTLVLGACVALTAGTDCGKECALCVYRLLGQQPPLTSPFQTCSLECEGGVDSRKLQLCREFLLDEENQITTLDAEDEDPGAAAPVDLQTAEAPEHQLVKKYGGFMKRYGGFMARRSPASPLSSLSSSSSLQGVPEEPGSPGRGEGEGEEEEEENIRMEILKILNADAEGHGTHGEQKVDQTKRYGGFMRRTGLQAGPLESGSLEAVLGRALKKRYGGFMRRVGRPEWLVDESSKAAGVLKRAWEDGSAVQKRYGGFMDFID